MSIATAWGTLGFTAPWVLGGLAALPLLWILLRVIPPAPRLMTFPPARLLADLQADRQVTSTTPWWILLLRLFILTLLLIGLAGPVLNPATAPAGMGALRLVIDNGWDAARTWETQKQKANELIAHAQKQNRSIYILTTAAEPGQETPFQDGPVSAAQARSIVGGLKVFPWPSSHGTSAKLIKEAHPSHSAVDSFWLSTGLHGAGAPSLIEALENQGSLEVFTPAPKDMPALLRTNKSAGTKISAVLEFSAPLPDTQKISVQALDSKGRAVDTQNITPSPGKKNFPLAFDLPESLRNDIGRLHVAGSYGAGGVVLFDDAAHHPIVGIAAPDSEKEANPLIESQFYLRRALEPYATIYSDTVSELLNKNISVLVLADTGVLPSDDLNAIEEWVKNGGLLLRFAGPRMLQGDNFLTPTPLRKGGRALDGALTWEKPATLAPFPENSPYFGLAAKEDITVRRQLLADPVPDLDKMTWATLSDGTPLITARALEHGLLVMVHTTATPEWSDMALSGLFVQILRRTVSMAGKEYNPHNLTGTLQPVLVLDGKGSLTQPDATQKPISAQELDSTPPSSSHPPGIYGHSGQMIALNLGDRLPPLEPLSAVPGLKISPYAATLEKNLAPALFLTALFLFFADWAAMIILQGVFFTRRLSFRQPAVKKGMALLVALAFFLSSPAAFASTEEDMVRYASQLHLAYIKTGSSGIDAVAATGLQGLSDILIQRTSTDMGGITGLDPETDDLSFFPLLYWPVTQSPRPLSPTAQRRIQHYLDHGGTIFFDTSRTSSNPAALSLIAGSLDIPPLGKMPNRHVLTKSFYLLRDFPGRYGAGTLWTEEKSAAGRDGVSSVIIADYDWARAWSAGDSSGGVSHEMALRFGVNLVMYALTGNYKDDQVHLPHIMERLGQ